MNNFAKIEDVEKLWRSLTEDEKERAKNLLPIVEDSLRMEADKVGKNLDRMIEEKSYLENVAKSVVVDVIARTLMTSTDAEPMTQRSESALGYSVSGTYLVPGGGLFIKKSELARICMAMIKGITVTLYEKEKINEDPFGKLIYKETPTKVENVLVASTNTQEVLDALNLTGKKAVYTIAIPKGDKHTWKDNKVEFFGEIWKVIGFPQQGIEQNIPLEWNQKWMVERYG